MDAPLERVFTAFTEDIAAWWVPDPLFAITPRGDGVLAFEGGAGGRLVATPAEGAAFTVGTIAVWDPPRRLVFDWRQTSFSPDMQTEVEVVFEPVGAETRVT
ncbi:MAG: SRPBCC domain-containing protein, partial [Parvularculaceae bacterium]|nr:SRPBCC domain-containing protein [Parvularculaceae bacterium]